MIGSNVRGAQGNKAGKVHDIIFHKETGNAKTIIMKEDGKNYYERDLAALRFENILSQSSDGDIQMTIIEDRIEQKNNFNYNLIKDTNFISLKSLRNGQLIDFEGNISGEVDAVIYNNAEAQKLRSYILNLGRL